jgi:2-keto-3-deoxy-L-rhamnonate aldolase RhmA
VGPGDLAYTMGVDLSTPEGRQVHEAAIMSVLQVCRKVGKIPGIAGGDKATYWLERGFLFVTSVSDMSLVVSGASAFLDRLAR